MLTPSTVGKKLDEATLKWLTEQSDRNLIEWYWSTFEKIVSHGSTVTYHPKNLTQNEIAHLARCGIFTRANRGGGARFTPEFISVWGERLHYVPPTPQRPRPPKLTKGSMARDILEEFMSSEAKTVRVDMADVKDKDYICQNIKHMAGRWGYGVTATVSKRNLYLQKL